MVNLTVFLRYLGFMPRQNALRQLTKVDSAFLPREKQPCAQVCMHSLDDDEQRREDEEEVSIMNGKCQSVVPLITLDDGRWTFRVIRCVSVRAFPCISTLLHPTLLHVNRTSMTCSQISVNQIQFIVIVEMINQ